MLGNNNYIWYFQQSIDIILLQNSFVFAYYNHWFAYSYMVFSISIYYKYSANCYITSQVFLCNNNNNNNL